MLEYFTGDVVIHELDADPVVERWAIAFYDTDGAAWCYIAHHLRRYAITDCDVEISAGGAPEREQGDAADERDATTAAGVATPPADPDRAPGDATPTVEVDAPSVPSTTSPGAPQFETFTGKGGHASKHDYDEIAAFVLEQHELGHPVGPAVAARFAVSAATAGYLIAQCRKRGFQIPKLSTGARSATSGTTAAAQPLPVSAPSEPVKEPEEPQVIADCDIPRNDIPADVTPHRTAPKDSWSLIPPPAPPVEHIPSLRDIDPSILDEPQPCESVGLTLEVVRAAYLEAENMPGVRPLADIADRFGVPHTWARAWVRTLRDEGMLPPRDQPQRERTAPPSAFPRKREIR